MNAITISIISLSIIFIATTLGSALVFFLKSTFSKRMSSIIMGFASGIMISAGFFGLLLPSINQAETSYGNWAPLPVVIGFLLGGLLLFGLDKIVPHLHLSSHEEEGNKNSHISRNMKFFLAVTLHNIPEGLAVGFACGMAIQSNDDALMWSALSLAIGIAIQNVPEGSAVSVPMLEEGVSKPKAFLYGMFSGIVEPIFGVVALFIATSLTMLLPWLLAFAAGAMIYVTIDELIPSMREYGYPHWGLWSLMIGFSIMMVLELVL